VLARLSELSPAFEIRLPLEPLQKALRWLDLLPRDERSGEEWQRAQDRIRIAAAPYLGAWRDVNDANSRLDVFLRIDGTMQSTLHFGQFGPTFAELFVREDGTLDWSFNRNGCEYQWIDPGRILAKPGTNRRWQRVDLTPKP
jgi:hypothetical protein